ncbi:MAG: hypothetical protein ACD_62C00600G0004 [uncultured bacterium]|nr:MAG: hypothetical protein ACD_62C00600G0004 [uncultured bacterium]HLD45771.1 transglutaminase family protein [bacterium]
MKDCLKPTYYIDFEDKAVMDFVHKHTRQGATLPQQAQSLFYAVRDGIQYNPYEIETSQASLKASATLGRGHGFCIAKAVVMVAACRAVGIESRLGFADLINHRLPEKLKAMLGSNHIVYHGYCELYLHNKWIKVTPVFPLALCQEHGYLPVSFDGISDAIFQKQDVRGNPHMEYIGFHGVFDDLPFDEILKAFQTCYPKYFTKRDNAVGVS